MELIKKSLLLGATIFLLPYLFSGIKVENFGAALAAALLLAVFELFMKPILFILTLPFTLLSFGIFLLIMNGLTLYLIAGVIHGFEILYFSHAVGAAFLISIIQLATNMNRNSQIKSFRYSYRPKKTYKESNSQRPQTIQMKQVSENKWE